MRLTPFLLLLTVFLLCNCSPQPPVHQSSVARTKIGNLVIEGVPTIPPTLASRTTLYQQSRPLSLSGWDREGKGLLVATRAKETDQIHHLPGPDADFSQVTDFKEPARRAILSPDPSLNGFLFTKDAGGNEFAQIFWYDFEQKESTMLSDGKAVNGGIVWSNSGRRFAFNSTRRNGVDFDVFISEIESPSKAQPVVERGGGGLWVALDWSPDDSKLLIKNYVSITESYLYVLSLGSGNLEPLNSSEQTISYRSARWSAEGTGIFLISDENSEFQTLRFYDLDTKEITPITAKIPWDVGTLRMSPNREFMAFITNENGSSQLYVMVTETMEFSPVSGLPAGLISTPRFHPSGRQLAVSTNSPESPGAIYVIERPSASIKRWKENQIEGLDTQGFVTPESIYYPSFDSVNGKPRLIPAYLYKPKNVQGKMPVVVTIHGGPEGQFRPRFSWLIQYYVNEMGIAVIAPNVRGSSGYGKSYLKMDNGYKREASVKDIGALLEWVEDQPDLDPFRVAVSGGSYGGFMVLASMVAYDKKLRCGVDRVGISNFVTFLENTQSYRRDLRRVEYGDERIPEMRDFLHKISPTTNAKEITKPLFVIQGLNDPRVPASESEQMVEVIRSNGGNVWYLLAKDEGHGFRKRSNSDYATNATILFLQENLLK